GAPGSDSTLETALNNFTTSLQSLSTSPDSTAARSSVVDAAQVLSQQLNGLTGDIQGLRTDAELGLADAVTRANDAMARLAQINQQIASQPADTNVLAGLLDQRDHYLDQLAQTMDINVVENANHQVTVATNSGVQLVSSNQAAQLQFDAHGTITANSAWDTDPAKRTVGTLTLVGTNG